MNEPQTAPAPTPTQPSSPQTEPKPPPTPPNGAPPEPQTPAPPEDKRIVELEGQMKRLTQERMTFAAERRAWKQEMQKREGEMSSKLSEYEAWQKQREDRNRNPAKYLKAEYGEDWYDKLSKVQLDGTPPAALIASELDERVGKEVAAIRKEFADYKAEVERKEQERAAAENNSRQESYLAQAVAYLKGAEDKYPFVHAFGQVENIPSVILAHERDTRSVDENGETLPGEVLTFEAASQKMEQHLKQKYEAAAQRITPKAATQTQPQSNTRTPDVPRRTLSTRLTGQTQPSIPRPETEAERRKRAIAAGEAVEAARRQRA